MMWVDHYFFLGFGIAALLTAVANWGNKTKQAFCLVVALFLFTSLLIPDVLTDLQIHAVGIAYDAIIMSCLFGLGCKEYQRLILIYPALILNEVLMASSWMAFGDVYFMLGQGVTWALYIILISLMWMKSDGISGFRRAFDDLRRRIHSPRHHA